MNAIRVLAGFNLYLHQFDMKILFFIFFSTFYFQVNSQKLEGFVIDISNENKLSFVNISFKNLDKGTYSNQDGYYTINLKEVDFGDSLIVSHIGYETKSFKLSDFKKDKNNNLNIKLVPKNDFLNEVYISDKKTKYNWFADNLGTNKKTVFTSSVPFGYEVSVFINNKKRKLAKLEELKLKFKKQDETLFDLYKTYYRISFYKKDENNFPGELLSYENIIIRPENKNKTIKINLKNKNLFLPKDGFFIGVETINPNDTSPKNSMYLTYPNLLYTHSEEKITFKRYRGKKWNKDYMKSVFKKDYFKVPYINLKVKYMK